MTKQSIINLKNGLPRSLSFARNDGFTLAEVLITLVIIGVIAAMTVPTLMNRTDKKEYAAKLKKAYSVMQQSVHKIAMDKGYPQGDYSFFNNDNFIDEFAKTVNVTKKCDTIEECFASDNISKISASHINYFRLNGSREDFVTGKTVITSDGILYTYVNSPELASYLYGISQTTYSVSFGRIIVDVNGANKPNKLGIDTFIFYIVNPKGIIPAGIDDNAADCIRTNYGKTCAAKVLKEGEINY